MDAKDTALTSATAGVKFTHNLLKEPHVKRIMFLSVCAVLSTSIVALANPEHVVTLPTVQAQAEANLFPDVPKGHWAYSAVMRVANLGIVLGDRKGFNGQAGNTAARPDAVVPLDSWVYAAYDRMEEIQGFIGCSLFRRKESQTYTRYEFAIFTLRLREQNDWQHVNLSPQGALLGQAGVKDIIAAFEREFQPETTQLLSLPPK